MARNPRVVEADLTLTPDGWRSGVRIVLTDDRSRIASVDVGDHPARQDEVLRLRGRALLPGLVNTHSHAFQRGLRGRGESFPRGAGSFWTWREAMYGLVDSMDADRLHEVSHRAFAEMREAGITSVGEFHYLHHDGSGRGYAFDEIVLRAAAEAGIRIVLLNAYYRTGGIGRPLSGGQRRFGTASLDEFWSRMADLERIVKPGLQSLGVVAHSIRAVPLPELVELHRGARSRDLVFHMHLEEQPAEIEESRKHYGAAPMALVNRRLDVDGRTTMVHCTHTDAAELARYLDAGGRICICPLTEANLGDGFADVPAMLEVEGRVCLGTDSNARISLLEEARLLEYGQRLRTETRGVCRDESGDVAPLLWQMATAHGAAALGLAAGSIEEGGLADFAVVDLEHPALAGWDEESLLAALLLGSPDDVIVGTAVAGDWRWRAGAASDGFS